MPGADDDPKDDWLTGGPALDLDGKIEGLPQPKDQRRSPESWRISPKPEAPLELAQPVPPPAAPQVEPAQRTRRSPISLRTLGLVALFITVPSLAFVFSDQLDAAFSGLQNRLREYSAPRKPDPPPARPGPEFPAPLPVHEITSAVEPTAGPGEFSLTIQSTPPGATVFIEEKSLGETPYIGSNGFPAGQSVPVRLRLPGYLPWSGTVRGGENVRLETKLIRSPPRSK